VTKTKKQTKRRRGQPASKAMLDSLTLKKCVVCGEDIWWDDSALPAACNEHTYESVYMSVESNAGIQPSERSEDRLG